MKGKTVPEKNSATKDLALPDSRIARRYVARREQKLAPRLKVSKSHGKLSVAVDHKDPVTGNLILLESCGTANEDFANGLLNQLINVGRRGKDVETEDVNFMLAMVAGIQPRDEAEAMLAAQMAAIHNAIMTAARRLVRVESIPQQDSASNMLNKLARTYATQVDALKKYRSTGEQSIRVQHVTVNDGGQAVVAARI
jgi:hypothetical protein